MCDNWKQNFSNNYSCNNQMIDTGDGEYLVQGNLPEAGNSNIIYWAASPPTYTTSFTGSGLPYPNYDLAYENTPNQGMVKAINGNYKFNLRYPNAYYAGLGTKYIKPCYHIKVCGTNKVFTFDLGNGIPFRMLTYPEHPQRTSPNFYEGSNKFPIRTQEQILRDSGYPSTNTMNKNFWGTKPPV